MVISDGSTPAGGNFRLKAPDVCVFDRLTHSVTYQDSHEPRTYPLNEITDIQIRLEKPLVPQTDSDFDQFFDITYQIQLVLRDGRQFPVQQYFHREYKWEPGTDKLPTARVWAEEVAQCIRQFISKDQGVSSNPTFCTLKCNTTDFRGEGTGNREQED